MSSYTKKLIVLFLTAAMLLPLLGFSSIAEDLKVISLTSPAIAVDVNEEIKLSDYSVDGMICNDITWTIDGEETSLENGVFKAPEKGVYRFDGKKDGKDYVFFVVAKNSDETEYVLYENNFDDESDLEGLRTVAGNKPTIKDGELVLTGSSRVLLPDFLELFGDYKIDADVKMTTATDPTRWMSIMYRVRNNNYPYYQMAVRQNATLNNGVEFAECTPQGQWNVMLKVPFIEALNPSKQYKFTVEAFGNYVQESIDDISLIYTDKATDYKTGKIGFQNASSTMKVDNVKVTLMFDVPKKPEVYFETVDVRDFESNLMTTPTIVSYINTKSEYENILVDSPATALFYINSDGDITDKSGSKLATLDEMYGKIENKVIAGFIPENKDAVDNLIKFLAPKKIEDVMLASADKELVKYARESYKMMRGAIIYSADHGTDNESLMEIRHDVNASISKIAILPYEMAKKELVNYLQERLITVWVTAPEEETEAKSMAMILSGANGVVVSNRKQTEECFTKFEEKSFTREIYIIGHRGVPSVSPENSVEGSVLATKYGAQIIENDIYITKDNVIVVMHDGTIDRTTTGKGNVEDFTYAELQEFTLTPFSGQYPDIKIPTLEDYFKEFKDTDTLIFVEIKSGKQQLLVELAKLVKEYDFYDQMSVISFSSSQLVALQKHMPGMSMGFLCSAVTSSDAVESVRQALILTQDFNTTFNQSYNGMTEEFIIQSNHRGMTVWPWTYRDRNDLNKYFMYGTYGLTTDYAQWTSQTIKKVVSDSYDYNIPIDESKTIPLNAIQYNGKEIDVSEQLGKNAKIKVLWGEELVTIDGTKFTAKAEGEVAFYIQYKTELMKNDKDVETELYIHSPVIRLSLGDLPSESLDESDVSDESKAADDLKDGIQWYVYLIIIVAVVAVGGIVFVVIKKKK